MESQALTYQDAGVDIDEAQRALRSVDAAIRNTLGDRVIGSVGSFGGLYSIANLSGVNRPVLVSSIDGVGTKTKVAAMMGDHSNLGADIVNHCVNDILCQGARPLFFLDYFGCSRLQASIFEQVVKGAAEACAAVGCALIGGETAEMPQVYHDDEVDIVGSIVGLVDMDARLPRGKMQPGDAIIGIASNGLHTNGFSLARRALFEMGGLSVRDVLPGLNTTIGEELLRPHRSYFSAVYPLIQDFEGLYAIAHVTGGGLFDNLPRVMPSNCRAVIDRRSWTPLPIFDAIQQCGNVPLREMFRTFNMGIGMVLFVARDIVPTVIQRLSTANEMAAVIGEVQAGSNDVQIV